MNKIQSFFCFNKQKQINNFTKSKYSLLIMFNILMFICFCITIGVGYQPAYVNMNITSLENINLLPENIQGARAVSIFFIAWFMFSSIWLIKLGVEESKNRPSLICFSWIIFFNFYVLFKLIQEIKFKSTIDFIKFNFEPSLELKSLYNRRSAKYIVSIVILLLMFPVAIMVWMPEYKSTFGVVKDLPDVWFYGIQYFTLQTNLLCVLYLLVFAIFPYFKAFRSNTFLIWCLSYLIIVSLTYNLGLLPINIISEAINDWTWYKWFKTMYEHVLNPILFLGYSLYCFLGNRINEPRKYWTVLKFGMVIPTIYLFYALVLPFMTSQSVYGIPTNCNPSLPNGGTFMPYGQWYMVFAIILFWFIFVGMISFINWVANKGYKMNEAKINNNIESIVNGSK